MLESHFEELKRYLRFTSEDETALCAFAPHITPHFTRIAREFYARIREHAEAQAVFSGPAQVERLQGALCEWMALVFSGPWDQTYYTKRARIGQVHVRISLPQRFMFGAMGVIRQAFAEVAQNTHTTPEICNKRTQQAIHKILDLELAIMLETYREAFVERVQALERLEKLSLQHQLEESEARYAEIVEKAEALICTIDRVGQIVLFNSRCERVTGHYRAQAIGRSWFELFVQETDREQVHQLHESVRRGEPFAPYEGPVPASVGNNRRVRWHFTTLPGGPEPVLCAIGLDVSEEHELEVRTRRAERLASLGTMAAGLAHEIRNPLNAAHLQLKVAQRKLSRGGAPDVPSALSAVQLASSEMGRLANLVEDFLQFARPQPLRISAVDLRATAEVTVALVSPEAAAAGVTITLDPGVAVNAECDDEKIKQVLLNLIRNAIEATNQDGQVQIRVNAENGYAKLLVQDNGRGFPINDPIFEPFFTTKQQGTGLGLSVVHRIITDHSGRIEITSQPGNTCFTVLLPLCVHS